MLNRCKAIRQKKYVLHRSAWCIAGGQILSKGRGKEKDGRKKKEMYNWRAIDTVLISFDF